MKPPARSAGLWIWTVATLVPATYFVILLMALFFVGIAQGDSVGKVGFTGFLAAAPVAAFAVAYIALRPWGNRAGQIIVSATFATPLALVAFGIGLYMG